MEGVENNLRKSVQLAQADHIDARKIKQKKPEMDVRNVDRRTEEQNMDRKTEAQKMDRKTEVHKTDRKAEA